MERLLKALLTSVAATGAAYVVLDWIMRDSPPRVLRERGELIDEDEFTEAEKQELLRELSGLT